ncbi:membrane bound O-acyl transferase family-domain-containing protein [Penicillium longicatenatum]|nr:membrane bound O-acyl transferase family-domain-containing protein [Penicillium longicatenatum]
MRPNPLFPAAVQTALVVTTIGYTSAQSPLRLGVLVLVALCTWNCLNTALEFFVRLPWASLVGGYSVMLLFHYVDIGLLTRWEFNSSTIASPTSDGKVTMSQPTWGNQLRFGIWAAFNARCLGTSEQVRNIPQFSDKDPNHIPSRAAFLRRTARIAALSYLGMDLLSSMSDPEVGNRFLVPSRVPFFRRLGEVTLEEVSIRSFSTIAMGAGLVCSQGGIYNIFAFISVLTGMSDPSDWPPFYGSLSDAYSLRRLWNRTWHQCNTHKFRRISSFVVQDVLQIKSTSPVFGYAKIIFVFLTSALMHYLIDLSIGFSVSNSGAIPFFCTQALGLIIEDLVSSTYFSFRGITKDQPATRGQKMLGQYRSNIEGLDWATSGGTKVLAINNQKKL